MNLVLTDTFKEDFKNLSPEIQKRAEKSLRLLTENLRHPSLRVKKMEGLPDIWEARVNRDYRFTFQLQEKSCILRRIGPHDKTLRSP